MNPEEILAVVQDEIKKAAVTNSTYTQAPPSRSIFAPENLDPVVKVLVPVTAPVRRILPRVEGFGQAANWNKITSKLDPQALKLVLQTQVLLTKLHKLLLLYQYHSKT